MSTDDYGLMEPINNYPAYFGMAWGAVEYGDDVPVRITILNVNSIAALQCLARDDDPVDGAANIVGQHMSEWLENMVRMAVLSS